MNFFTWICIIQMDQEVAKMKSDVTIATDKKQKDYRLAQ